VARDEVDEAIEAVRAAADDGARNGAEVRLRKALEPRWRALLGRFTTLPEGVKFLVDLRAEMLSMARDDAAIKALSDDLRMMLSTWFDIGLLDLRQIDWASPAVLLEKLIAYESVHAIKSWDDLKNRLDSDRRCFAFFHPNMPNEPLIFVEVALVNGMAPSVDQLLDEGAPEIDPKTADTAIFYSISNAQRGLDGISFGNFLIKRVVELLSHDFPNLKAFATLSPIPGFSRWLEEQMKDEQAVLLTGTDRKILAGLGAGANDVELLGDVLGRVEWLRDEVLAAALKEPISRLAARYLLVAKGRDARALDPVANFHLTNGARAERLNWLGDRSERGLSQSHGLMINYLYRLGEIEANSTAYLTERKIAKSSPMRTLALG
ncbi:MAG: malonyl-CoA decarboxylase, partial [Alphaproteobacteria bacterium]|nr:malonyl-CoA decarboxylase [Alphaproteobacteria bacterium]